MLLSFLSWVLSLPYMTFAALQSMVLLSLDVITESQWVYFDFMH